jgi:hypothetical protein
VIYHKICAFIRYPYQTIKNNFDALNILKDLSFDSFIKHFQKIMALRVKKFK